MKPVFSIKTPIGTGTIQYGEFMRNDERKNKYHCWWNGCGIGGTSNSMALAKKYLIKFINDYLSNEMDKLYNQATDIRVFLRGL